MGFRLRECLHHNRTVASRKKNQMLKLAEWASAKANAFNRKVEILAQVRKELLRASGCILSEICEALKAAELTESAEYSKVQTLTEMVESATVEEQSSGFLWSIGKEQLMCVSANSAPPTL